jgi:hypothetical protein
MKPDTMKPATKLFRVDVKLKYLVLSTSGVYTSEDVLKWLKEECHEGEVDDCGEISQVTEKEQVEDFDMSYPTYHDETVEEGRLLEDVINELNLDASSMIKKLKKMGYTITNPLKQKK